MDPQNAPLSLTVGVGEIVIELGNTLVSALYSILTLSRSCHKDQLVVGEHSLCRLSLMEMTTFSIHDLPNRVLQSPFHAHFLDRGGGGPSQMNSNPPFLGFR